MSAPQNRIASHGFEATRPTILADRVSITLCKVEKYLASLGLFTSDTRSMGWRQILKTCVWPLWTNRVISTGKNTSANYCRIFADTASTKGAYAQVYTITQVPRMTTAPTITAKGLSILQLIRMFPDEGSTVLDVSPMFLITLHRHLGIDCVTKARDQFMRLIQLLQIHP